MLVPVFLASAKVSPLVAKCLRKMSTRRPLLGELRKEGGTKRVLIKLVEDPSLTQKKILGPQWIKTLLEAEEGNAIWLTVPRKLEKERYVTIRILRGLTPLSQPEQVRWAEALLEELSVVQINTKLHRGAMGTVEIINSAQAPLRSVYVAKETTVVVA
jgi:hypothetical protein